MTHGFPPPADFAVGAAGQYVSTSHTCEYSDLGNDDNRRVSAPPLCKVPAAKNKAALRALVSRRSMPAVRSAPHLHKAVCFPSGLAVDLSASPMRYSTSPRDVLRERLDFVGWTIGHVWLSVFGRCRFRCGTGLARDMGLSGPVIDRCPEVLGSPPVMSLSGPRLGNIVASMTEAQAV